jgi:hypothetical protein
VLEDGLRELAANWDDVMSRLDEASGDEIRRLVAELHEQGGTSARGRIADILATGLPPEHPVRRALARGYMLVAAPLSSALLTALRERVTLTAYRPPDADPPSPAEILRAVRERLLSAPALTEDQVRQRGADPDDQRLIALRRPDGGWQWPAFQFARDAGPVPVVLAVNEVLGAAADPVGVADWWLSGNGWLGARPSELIGAVPDEHLVSAARAATEVV